MARIAESMPAARARRRRGYTRREMSDTMSPRLVPPSDLSRDEAISWLRPRVAELSLAERFELIDRLGIYRDPESRSGEGSSLAETAALRRALPALLEAHDVRTILDIPCGDFGWMRKVDLGDRDYLGADIVAEIVEENEARFGRPGRRFRVLDGAADALPRVDLIVCRDLLIHLSLGDIARTLRNFLASGSRRLLASHYSDRRENPDIPSGDFRPVNLCAPPFDFPPPLAIVNEESRQGDGAYPDRGMALWEVAALAGSSLLQEHSEPG